MMLFFIYWCVVLDPATWSPDSVPLSVIRIKSRLAADAVRDAFDQKPQS